MGKPGGVQRHTQKNSIPIHFFILSLSVHLHIYLAFRDALISLVIWESHTYFERVPKKLGSIVFVFSKIVDNKLIFA